MDRPRRMSFSDWCMTAYLRFKTWRRGELVGTDAEGNRYYRDRRSDRGLREGRWVVFNGGEVEASRVPPEWHGWMHHQQADPPAATSPFRRPWQKPHEANLTGTLAAYRPPGSTLRGGERARASGDYEPWTPS